MFEENEERKGFFHGDHANFMSYIQQAANAAINGAIGTSHLGTLPASKKRKNQELFFGGTASDQSMHTITQFQQENHLRAPATSSSLLLSPSLSPHVLVCVALRRPINYDKNGATFLSYLMGTLIARHSAMYQFLASSEMSFGNAPFLELQLHDRRRISGQICPLEYQALHSRKNYAAS
ncbi:unnamed protein product [Camellia sinensis]